MSKEIKEYLRIHAGTHGLSEKTIDSIAQVAKLRQYKTGEAALVEGQDVGAVSLIVSGHFSLCRDGECRKVVGFLGPNDLVGLLSVAHEQPAPVTITAAEPSLVIELQSSDVQQLLAQDRVLARSLVGRATARMTQQVLDKGGRPRIRRVAFIHMHASTLAVTEQLQSRLCDLNETVGRILNSESRSHPGLLEKCQSLTVRSNDSNYQSVIREQLARWVELDRIVFDVDFESAELKQEQLRQLLSFAERVYAVLTPGCATKIIPQLTTVLTQNPEWQRKLDIIWVLDEAHDLAPLNPELRQLAHGDFKVKVSASGDPALQRTPEPGIERIIHALRGVRLGLALGGGAARGMSHLGVLRALEEQGIVIDAIAGTSVGAMMGVPYCGGYSPENTVERFTRALTPGGVFRWIAKGDLWYMLYKYRSNAWEGMLREHFFDWQLEQLLIPLTTIATDLVSGKEYIRRSGDCTIGILESINLGGISRPICRDGMVLVDGGYLNNVPADTLVRDGATYVISVDVSSAISSAFGGNTSNTPTEQMHVPHFNQVLSRIREVAQKNISVIGGAQANFTIAPDVSRVAFTDFKSTPQTAEIGYTAAMESMASLKTQLHEVDPLLFPVSGDRLM